jgi:carnitine 3-dehydrogenase
MVVKPISGRIGVVGTGVIGAGWVAYFLSRGFDVAATDPADGAERRLQDYLDDCWPTLERLGFADDASRSRLQFDTDLMRATEGCAFVQESGPERLDVKRDIMAKVSAVVSSTTLIATSSSGILISDIQDAAVCPERVLLGHPFNPAQLMPLVEVAGGRLTTKETIETAIAFYSSIGKKPIKIRCEISGHIANRLQAALRREAFYLVEKGIASVEDVDTAIAYGPGLRWALAGPFLNMHLSGGTGGIVHVLDHLGPPLESWWRELGVVSLSKELNQKIAEGVSEELAGEDAGHLVARRNELLLNLLQLKENASRGL